MDGTVIEAMSEYYKLKNSYEEKLSRKKKRITSNRTLPLKEKKAKIKQIKKICINCKQQGGTIFNTDGRIISAVCGAEKPCKLDIEIDRGKYENTHLRKNGLFTEIQNIHSDIISTKLDLLFNFINEDSAVSLFQEYRGDLDIISKNYVDESKKYTEITEPEQSKILLSDMNIKLFLEKEKLRSLQKQFTETPDKKYIDEMVERYITIIQPLAENIRETTYVTSLVEKSPDTNESSLIELPYTLEQMYNEETKDDVAKVIRFNK